MSTQRLKRYPLKISSRRSGLLVGGLIFVVLSSYALLPQANTPPVLRNLERSVLVVNTTSNVNVTNTITIDDPDSENMTGAEIRFVDGTYNAFVDRLFQLASRGNITAEWDASSGVLTLSGEDTQANYESALRNVIYNFQDFLATPQVNKIAITVSDGPNTSEAVVRYIAVKNPSYIPSWLQDITKEVNEDQDLAFTAVDFRSNYLPDESRFTGIDIRRLPQHGSLVYQSDTITEDDILSNSGSFRIEAANIAQLVYRPAPNYSGADAFVWNSFDGTSLATSDALVNITVAEVNDAPDITAPTEITGIPEDNEFVLQGISVDDVDDAQLRISLSVINGTLSFPESLRGLLDFASGDGQLDKTLVFSENIDVLNAALAGLTYLSDQDYAGPDQLVIEASDRLSGTGAITVNATVPLTIVQTNDPPRISEIPATPLTYTEGDAPAAVVPQISVTDDEDDDIIGGTVTVTEGFVEGEDAIGFTQQADITVTQEANRLVLQGAAPATTYQQLLRSVTYQNNSQNPSTQSRVVAFQLTDAEDVVSDTASRTIQVVSVDDAPVLSNLETQPLNFVQFAGPVNISSNIQVADVDSENLTNAVLSLGNTYIANQDVLLFEDTDKITGQWNSNTGTLTLRGTASLAEYTRALQNVQYQNNRETPNTAPRTLRIQVFNGQVSSNAVSRAINIITNERPTIESFDKTTDEDTPLPITYEDFLNEGNYQDSDNFPSDDGFSRIAILVLPLQGVLVVGNDTITQAAIDDRETGYEIPGDSLAQLSYVPSADFAGQDAFTWNAFDGAQYAAETAQVNIIVNPVDDPPVVSAIALSVDEDDTLSFRLSDFEAAYQDAEGQALQKIIIRTLPAQGLLLLNGIRVPINTEISAVNIDRLVYVPASNYSGSDTFAWAASDGTLVSAEAAPVTLLVAPVNDPPVVQSFTIAIADGEVVRFAPENFINHYIDVENDPLAFITIVASPANGQLLLNETPVQAGDSISAADIGALVYQQDPSSGVKDAFTWKASDGTNLSVASATASIIVGIGVTDLEIALNEDERFRFTIEDFTDNYGNPEAELQAVRIETLPLHGTLRLDDFPVTEKQVINVNNLGQLTYLPDSNYFGTDSLRWNATDGTRFSEESALLRLTINPVNDLPQIAGLPDITLVAGSSSEPISFNISDVETASSDLVVSASSDNQEVLPNEQLLLGGEGDTRTLVVNTLEGTEGVANVTVSVLDSQNQSQTMFEVRVVPYSIELQAVEDVEICSDAPITISAGGVSGGVAPYVYNWTCDQENCQIQNQSDRSITISPERTVNYYVQVTDANGILSNLDTVQVLQVNCNAVELEIPSGFTPNGDNVHDTWDINRIDYVENVVVRVFNRSGQQVYQAGNYRIPWDGTHQGEPLPVGTYYYVIDVDRGARVFRGSVTILR